VIDVLQMLPAAAARPAESAHGRGAVRASHAGSLPDTRRKLLIAYGLPLLGGAMVAGVTALIFWVIQNYLA
jgi:hypothetical protein